jgi:hypothetical protein
MVRRRFVLMTPGHFDRIATKTYDSSFRLSSIDARLRERKRGESSVVLRCIQAQTFWYPGEAARPPSLLAGATRW